MAAAYGLSLVGTEIVHDDDVARRQGRHQELLDVSRESAAVDRPIEHQGRVDPIDAQGGQEGQRAPPPVRRLGDQTLAPLRAAMAPRHVRLHPGLIDEDQPTWRQPALILLPARTPAGPRQAGLARLRAGFFLGNYIRK